MWCTFQVARWFQQLSSNSMWCLVYSDWMTERWSLHSLVSWTSQQCMINTYCEDDPPSWIYFGKSKYGETFTTEQVEDVKTFFKILGVIVCDTLEALCQYRWPHHLLNVIWSTFHQNLLHHNSFFHPKSKHIEFKYSILTTLENFLFHQNLIFLQCKL